MCSHLVCLARRTSLQLHHAYRYTIRTILKRYHSSMASSNPANFANLPKDKLKEVAAKGGHASHGSHTEASNNSSHGSSSNDTSGGHADRNPDGTFTKGSHLAKELGAQGGHAAHGHSAGGTPEQSGRNPDGTFKKGSELAHELGAKGGHAAHEIGG